MPVDLSALCDDLMAETTELEKLLSPLDEAAWSTPTPAEGWNVKDQISHLAYFDEAVVTAATEPDRFREERDALLAGGGDFTGEIAEQHRSRPGTDVHEWFRRTRAAVVEILGGLDPSTRVPWYGPDMSVASAVTARIMETWAHGQDVADGLGTQRTPTKALRQVAHIGVRAMPNSFVTHGRETPTAPILVELTAPGGDTWTWGDPAATDVVRGRAVDFCLVTTRRRHLDDTDLVVEGPVAQEWMSIAQAFAGPPGSGRAPGQFPKTAH
jgi:uncharacterized protein (TIGR03084 family)